MEGDGSAKKLDNRLPSSDTTDSLRKHVSERHACLTHFLCVSIAPGAAAIRFDDRAPALSDPRRLSTPLSVGSVTQVLP